MIESTIFYRYAIAVQKAERARLERKQYLSDTGYRDDNDPTYRRYKRIELALWKRANRFAEQLGRPLHRLPNFIEENLWSNPADGVRINTIESIRKYCSMPNWNGYHAKPVNETVLSLGQIVSDYIREKGYNFIELFPQGDGSLSFEFEVYDFWYELRPTLIQVDYEQILTKYPLNKLDDSLKKFDEIAVFYETQRNE